MIACRTKSEKKQLNVQIDNQNIGWFREFCYIGSKIRRDGRYNADIRSRIGQAKIAFAKKPQLLVSNIDLEISVPVYFHFIFSIQYRPMEPFFICISFTQNWPRCALLMNSCNHLSYFKSEPVVSRKLKKYLNFLS